MSRARILADYVSSGDELADKAPLASPTFTGTVAIPNVANLETAVVANTAKVTNYNQTKADINALDITELGTVTSGNLSNSALVYPTGHVLQTVANSVTAASTARTTQSYAKVLRASDSVAAYTGQITNVGASNKVLIHMLVNTYIIQNDTSDGAAICLYRGSTIIYQHDARHSSWFGVVTAGMNYYKDWQYSFLDDSPDTGTNDYYLGYAAYSNASIKLEARQPFHIILQEIQS